MKKALFMVLLLIVALASSFSTATAANSSDYLVGDRFLEQNGERYWGPYGPAYSLIGGALVFDNSVADGWVTLNFKDDEMANDAYRYALITLKTDSPADAQEVILTFGNVKKSFTEWGIQLNTKYTLYALDLPQNGFIAWGDGTKSIPDFALNVVPGKKFLVYVDRIKLTNNPPVTGN